MPTKKRRSFGKVVKMRSGRYQASYMNPQGQRDYAPDTFIRRRDAEVWLSRVEADLSRGSWVGQEGRHIVFEVYAKEYLKRPSIGDRWREMCTINLRLHMADIAPLTLTEITSRRVRQWHDKVSASPAHGKTVVAQSYRFLRAVMNQAVRDELILKNPCNIPGAGSDHAEERPIATPQQLSTLLLALHPQYRAPVLIAAWCSLRRSEIVDLKPEDVDLESKEPEIYVRDAKTRAGIRSVKIPPHLVPFLEEARQWSTSEWYFTNRRGRKLTANTFYRAFERARSVAGLDHLTIHDLRHTGNTYAASAGATLKDLMKRLGHTSPSMASRYLHTVDGRDAEIARRLSKVAALGDAAELPKRVSGLH